MNRRRLPLQAWIVVAVLTVVAPPLTSVVAALANGYRELPAAQRQAERAEAVTGVVRDARSWEDAAWQRGLDRTAAGDQVDVLLAGTDGRLVYVTPGWGRASEATQPLALVRNEGGERGMLYVRQGVQPPAPIRALTKMAVVLGIGLVVLLLVVGVLSWAARRFILEPLSRLTEAARQIEAGILDVRVPAGTLAEIDEVATAFTAMSAALRASRDRQEELERQHRFVVAAIAHDLRTPLFTLRGYADALERGVTRSPAAARRYARVCAEKAAVLERRVSELLAFARMNYVQLSARRERVDLHGLVAGTVADMRPRIDERAVVVEVEDAAGGSTVEGDAELLGRALENVLDNAVRHAQPAGRVVVRCERRASEVVVVVADDGAGIDARDLPRIFEPLYRGEDSRSRQTGGSGLGLAIAWQAVVANGGRLEAANGLAGGAVFTMWPPASPPEVRPGEWVGSRP